MTVQNREIAMHTRLKQLLRRIADELVKTQRYRILRAHLWDDAIHELQCGGRC